jgi:K+-sensing histidine kinase KdpD
MEEYLQAIIPFPFIYDNERLAGYSLKQPSICQKCDANECLRASHSICQSKTCSKGLSYGCLNLGETHVVINGLIVWPNNQNVFRGEQRKQLKPWALSADEIVAFVKRVATVEGQTQTIANSRARDSVAFLHDISTSVGIVLSWCQEVIDKQPGYGFDDKIKGLDRETSNLFASINLLQEQLQLASVIVNPDCITYGQKTRSRMSGLLYKMVKLFEPRAHRRNMNIKFNASCDPDILVYDSFQFIPLILLDNAIKYSTKGTCVNVYLDDDADGISISVSSTGLLVPESQREVIFKKYVRGENAEKMSQQGIGLGLYMARLIAEAHNASIKYSALPSERNNYGLNNFTILFSKQKYVK